MRIEDLFKNIPVVKIFGTAGAGKTTKIIDMMNDLFKQNVAPERIGFVSFTNKAVDEMAERILVKFPQFKKEQFCFFKTIHAMAYSKSNNKKIMQAKDIIGLAKDLGLPISYNVNPEDCGGSKKGDKIITIESLSRLRMIPLKQQWFECNFDDLPFYLVESWQKALNSFKNKHNFVDFTDLLSTYNGSALDVDYLFVDEAQDLCPLQWKVINEMAANCQKVIIAGDDDQLIFKWAGASVDYILGIKADEEIILAESHRLPANIYTMTRKLLGKISNRKPKDCKPNKADGAIITLWNLDGLEFDKEQEYLILIRNRYQYKNIVERLERLGLPYINFGKSSTEGKEIEAIISWERFRKNKTITFREFEKCKSFSSFLKDKDDVPSKYLEEPWFNILNLMPFEKMTYFRAILENGYKFSQTPKIKISTIHQAKGGECDNVVVITDVSNTTWRNIHSDDEHRVWYVAISRAKKNLIIIRGQSNQFYKL